MRYTSFALLVIGLLFAGAACQPKSPTTNTTRSGSVTIQPTRANAFGELAGLTAAPTSAQRSADTATVGTTTELKAVPVPASTYTYVFSGTPLTFSETTVQVLERSAGSALPFLPDVRAIAGLGRMNFQSQAFSGIETLAIRSGDEVWNVLPLDGTISMYRNSTTGSTVPLNEGTAVDLKQLSNVNSVNTNPPVDIAAAIGIANDFLSQRSISTASYGDPVAAPNQYFALAADSVISSRPVQTSPTVQIVYPLVINGLPVVQQSGEPVGLWLNIDLTAKTVMSLYSLTTLSFTQSAYPAVTDWATVETLAERGGIYGYTGKAPEGTTTTTINLGNPDRVLMSSYRYDGTRSHELYVPALRFPLTNPPAGYAQSIVVPLAKELVTNRAIDVIEPATGTGSSGSAIVPEIIE